MKRGTLDYRMKAPDLQEESVLEEEEVMKMVVNHHLLHHQHPFPQKLLYKRLVQKVPQRRKIAKFAPFVHMMMRMIFYQHQTPKS